MRAFFICIGLIGSFCLGRFTSGWIPPMVVATALALIWTTLHLIAKPIDDPRRGRVDYPSRAPARAVETEKEVKH